MYLWKMYLNGEKVTFKFTEHTEEKEKCPRIADYNFNTDQEYQPDDSEIKPIIDAAKRFRDILALKPSFWAPTPLHIIRGFKKITIIGGAGLFDVVYQEGKVMVRTENHDVFTKEQFEALFDFIDVLIQNNWFF